MTVAMGILAMGEEALRDHEMEIVPGARHRHIEEAPLLLNLGSGAGAEVRWDASIDNVEHEDRFPFLAFGGMDRRKDQIILVEQRRAGLVAGRSPANRSGSHTRGKSELPDASSRIRARD